MFRSWTTKFCWDDGALITGIIEYNSAIYCPLGLNIDKVKEYFIKKK